MPLSPNRVAGIHSRPRELVLNRWTAIAEVICWEAGNAAGTLPFSDKKTSMSSTPPFLPGLPLIGNAHQFLTDPVPLLQRGYQQYGRIFSVRLGNKPMAVLLGPEYNRIFFEQTDKLLSMREGYPFLLPMFN